MKKILILSVIFVIGLYMSFIGQKKVDAIDDDEICFEYDRYTENYEDDENSYDFIGYLDVDFSSLTSIETNFDDSYLNQLIMLGNAMLEYHAEFALESRRIYLWVEIENQPFVEIMEPIAGNILINQRGEYDLLITIGSEYEDGCEYDDLSDAPIMGDFIWLSDVLYYTRSNIFGKFVSYILKHVHPLITGVVTTLDSEIFNVIAPYVRPVVVAGLRAVTKTMQTMLTIDGLASIGSLTLDMYEETDNNGNGTGIYHAMFDCWQQYAGYSDLYDTFFGIGTDMIKNKTHVLYDRSITDIDERSPADYIIWAWAGNYLNLGAGLELGVYKLDGIFNGRPFYVVDKTMALDFEIHLIRNDYETDNIIINHWNSNQEKQWWITGFNSNHQWVDIDNLVAIYKIEFHNISETMTSFWSAFDYAIQRDAYRGEIKWERDREQFTYSLTLSYRIKERAKELYDQTHNSNCINDNFDS